jgi:hypothetical protein
MRRIPKLILVANRGHLIAYRTSETGALEKMEKSEFHQKDETVEVQSQGQTPELTLSEFPQISAKISEILEREKPRFWGFSTPSEINCAILGGIDKRYLDKLAFNLKIDLTLSPPGEIQARFEKAAGQI